MPDYIVPIAILPIGYPKKGTKASHLHDETKTGEEITDYHTF
jgi:hypothetical protein